MTAQRWDDLPEDWSVELATGNSMGMLGAMLQADVIWRKLTKPQRELLLSAVAGYPVAAHARVVTRMVQRGLLDKFLNPTEAGKFIVRWRLK